MSIYSPFETQRLILREFSEDDYKGVFGYLSDEAVCEYMVFSSLNEQQTKEYVNRFLFFQTEEPRRFIKFIVTLKESNCIIGECGINMPSIEHKTGEIVYRFNKQYWGQGYATEAVTAMFDFGFSEIGLHRIDAYCDIRNNASKRVLEKAGMVYEGCLREHMWIKGVWRSSCMYSILEHEAESDEHDKYTWKDSGSVF